MTINRENVSLLSKKCKKIVDRGGYLRYTNQAVGNGALQRALKTDGIYLFARTKKKLLQKKFLTSSFEFGKIYKPSQDGDGLWKLNNVRIEWTPECEVVSLVYQRNRRQSIQKRDGNITPNTIIWAKRLFTYHGEFDPGSGRTLAACLTHASRTRGHEKLASYEIEWQTGE